MLLPNRLDGMLLPNRLDGIRQEVPFELLDESGAGSRGCQRRLDECLLTW